MSASSPTTRRLPLAIAVVYGESCGSNARRYGSSEVSDTVNERSASIVSLSAMVPVPDTARRGEAASSFSAISSLPMLMSPVTVPMPSSATKKSRTRPWTL